VSLARGVAVIATLLSLTVVARPATSQVPPVQDDESETYLGVVPYSPNAPDAGGAPAACSRVEGQVFARQTNIQYGERSRTTMRNSALNTGCGGSNFHAAAHMVNEANLDAYIEEVWLVGWNKQGATKNWFALWETFDGHQLYGNLDANGNVITRYPFCTDATSCNRTIRLKIENVPGTEKWQAFLDADDDGAYGAQGPQFNKFLRKPGTLGSKPDATVDSRWPASTTNSIS
jgi:hypothetical protein